MGFYIELKKTDSNGQEFKELSPPQVFWTLYGLAGFALTCMGLAAHALLAKLLTTGDVWDLILVGSIIAAVPIYLLIGIKLAWVRKFIRFQEDTLVSGYTLWNYPLPLLKLKKDEVDDLLLVNHRPSANVAPAQHEDSQYYIRGHWRILLKTKSGKLITLDRHTEKGALHSLQNSVRAWLQ